MKKLVSILVLLMMGSAVLYSQAWLTNFEKAKEEAVQKDQNIVLVFSGSDWCAPCIKLDRNIWQSQQFIDFSSEHFVLLKADFPRSKKNKLPKEQLLHNEQLAATYNNQGYFPLVLVLAKDGKVLGSTGYKDVSPDEYIKTLTSFEK